MTKCQQHTSILHVSFFVLMIETNERLTDC